MVQIERLTPVGRLLDRLTAMDSEDRVYAIYNEIVIAGGHSHAIGADQPANGVYEIALHGIVGSGRTVATACACWIAYAVELVVHMEAVANAWATLNYTESRVDDVMAAHATIIHYITDPLAPPLGQWPRHMPDMPGQRKDRGNDDDTSTQSMAVVGRR